MNLPSSSTDYQSAFSALSAPIFSDNVQDLLGTETFHTNPSAIMTVNSIADVVDGNDGVTTLREAINQANADNSNDLIVFDRSLFSTAQTITLSLGELDIAHNVDIIAPRDTLTGGDLVTVSGNNASRVFEIEAGATVSLNGLIVANGLVTGDNGGGIKNSGTLTLDNTIVRNSNSASTSRNFFFGNGGGIYNTGISTISNSIISGNSALSGGGIYNTGTSTVSNSTINGNLATAGGGGGIYNFNGNSMVNNSTISGNSAAPLDSSVGIFSLSGGGIYNTGNTGTSTVNNSTIIGNSAAYEGGGICKSATSSNTNTSTIQNSTISGNSARGGEGGGIYNYGNSTVDNSTISNNSARTGGGGIKNQGIGTLDIDNSTISGNSAADGGGIDNGGTIKVQNSTISINSASYGGGIFNDKTITVKNSTISNNSAGGSGGGIYNINSNTIQNSTISGNSAVYGGGIDNHNGISMVDNSTINCNSAIYDGGGINNSFLGTIIVQNSTISGNSAKRDGGGMYNSFSPLEVNNSTISGNSAIRNGGGIYINYNGIITLVFSTITLNQATNGGGLYLDSVPLSSTDRAGSNSVRNTIIASNLNSDNGINPDASGSFSSNGYNLIGDRTGSTGFDATGDIVGTSDNPIDPRLAPLDFYGGPTQTIALLPDSPAIDAGDPTLLDTDPTTDQRGFPRVTNGRADIGAFEFSA